MESLAQDQCRGKTRTNEIEIEYKDQFYRRRERWRQENEKILHHQSQCPGSDVRASHLLIYNLGACNLGLSYY